MEYDDDVTVGRMSLDADPSDWDELPTHRIYATANQSEGAQGDELDVLSGDTFDQVFRRALSKKVAQRVGAPPAYVPPPPAYDVPTAPAAYFPDADGGAEGATTDAATAAFRQTGADPFADEDSAEDAMIGALFSEAADLLLDGGEVEITDAEPDDRMHGSAHRGAAYLQQSEYPPGGASAGQEGGSIDPQETETIHVFGLAALKARRAARRRG